MTHLPSVGSHRALSAAVALFALAACGAVASAQNGVDLQAVRDLNDTAVGFSSSPSLFSDGASGDRLVVVGGYAYFNATTTSGRELWRCQEGVGSAEMVADIHAGPNSSDPERHAPAGNRLFFTADDGIHGRELWVTDGTAQGTSMVADLTAGSGSTSFGTVIGFGTDVLFVCDLGLGSELYRSDGTAAGTVLVADIRPGTAGSDAFGFSLLPGGGGVMFSADDGVHGREPWVSDGTTAGTALLADLAGGGQTSYPTTFGGLILGGWSYYGAFVGGRPIVCRTDGATNEIVETLPQTGSVRVPNPEFVFRGQAWFLVEQPGVGRELFATNGTTASTGFFADLEPGTQSSVIWGHGISADGNTLYLGLWHDLVVTDGTAANMVRVSNVEARNFVNTANGTVCRLEADPAVGEELYRVQPDGTYQLLGDLEPGSDGSFPGDLTELGQNVVFHPDVSTIGEEMWVTDGTPSGTRLLEDIDPRSRTDQVRARGFLSVGDRAYFGGEAPGIGSELWVTDGTAAGSRVVKDIRVGPEDSRPTPLGEVRGGVLLRADDGVHGTELWFTDGTDAGTVLVADIRAGTDSSFPSDGAVLDGVLYFRADDGVHGEELWRSDGTAAGTYMVSDIRSGSEGCYPDELTAAGRLIYFEANDGVHGNELWRSDGTANGTVLVADINTSTRNSGNAFPRDLSALRNGVAFYAYNGSNFTVWTAGPQGATEIASAADLGNNDADEVAATRSGRIYVLSLGSTFRNRIGNLFCIESGVVTQLTNYGAAADLEALRAVGENAVFLKDRSTIWGSDGSAVGTAEVAQAVSFFDDDESYAVGSTLYFRGSTDAEGASLWRTDGTVGGTSVVEDFVPGEPGADVEDFALVGGDLLFFADLPFQRNVLHALRRPGASVLPFGRGCGAPDQGLIVTEPVLGQSFSVDVAGNPGNTFVIVNAEIFPGQRFELLGCAFYFGQFPIEVVSANDTNAAVSIPLANDPTLVDADVKLQAVWMTPSMDLETSRGLWLSFDDR